MVRGFVEVRTDSASIRANAPQFEELFRQAPREVIFQATTMMRRWFGHTRKTLEQHLRTGKHRGLLRAMKNHGWVKWRVEPFGGRKIRSERALRTQIDAWATPDIGAVEGRFQLRSQVEVLHEFGGTVRAKAGALAVPIKFAKLSSRARRDKGIRTPKQYSESAEGRRNPLFLIDRRRKGRRVQVLARHTGEVTSRGKPKVESLWLLRKEVRIPASLGLRKSWDGDAGYRQRVLDEHLSRLVDGLGLRLRNLQRRAA